MFLSAAHSWYFIRAAQAGSASTFDNNAAAKSGEHREAGFSYTCYTLLTLLVGDAKSRFLGTDGKQTVEAVTKSQKTNLFSI